MQSPWETDQPLGNAERQDGQLQHNVSQVVHSTTQHLCSFCKNPALNISCECGYDPEVIPAPTRQHDPELEGSA